MSKTTGSDLIFPKLCGDEWPGMTIREWYAGLAMQGMLASYTDPNMSFPEREAAAKTAVEFADALIAELNKTP